METKIRSYGKVNLSLDISGVREDGYHELDTVMQKISLYDEVNVKWTHKPKSNNKAIDIKIKCNKPYLPTDNRNLAYKAADAMIDLFADQVGPGLVEIYIEKHLPVSAGLAGGSGNGAAVLVALNRLWKLGLDTEKLCEIGAKLGADVPFCVLSQNTDFGCALCQGTGTEVTPMRTKFKKALLLVKPSFGVSTKEVYRGIDDCTIVERPNTNLLVDALSKGNKQIVYDNMINVLEEYTLKHYPEVKNIKDKISAETFAAKVLMTGSGPTVFGIFDRVGPAKKACAYMRKKGYVAYWAVTL